MNALPVFYGSLYGFQKAGKKNTNDLGMFFCAWAPIAILRDFGLKVDLPEYKYNQGKALLSSIIAVPIVVGAYVGVGTLVGKMARKTIYDEDS